MSTVVGIVGIALIAAAVVVIFTPARFITPDVIEIKFGGATFKGGVVAILIAAGVFLLVYPDTALQSPTNPKTTPPGTAPPSPVAQVEFLQPSEGATIQAGQGIVLGGNVVGLDGDTLWLAATPEEGGQYYLAQTTPVADRDGPWRFVAPHVGDASDIGHNFVFKVIQAKPSCAQQLAAVRPNPEYNDSLVVPVLPDGCIIRTQRAVAVVR